MPRPKKMLDATSTKVRSKADNPSKTRKLTEVSPGKPAKRPSLAGLMNLAAAKTDTAGTKINVAETKRVIRVFLDEIKLQYPDPTDRMTFLLKNFM